jgi:hypothetical protein
MVRRRAREGERDSAVDGEARQGGQVHRSEEHTRASELPGRSVWLAERRLPRGRGGGVLARIIQEFAAASAESTESSGLFPSGLLGMLFKYACVGLRSESPESPALSTLSRRKPMNNPGKQPVEKA